MGVLPGDSVGDGLLQGIYVVQFAGRSHGAVTAFLIDAPVGFQRIIVRMAKLHGDFSFNGLKLDFYNTSSSIVHMPNSIALRARDACRPAKIESRRFFNAQKQQIPPRVHHELYGMHATRFDR